MKKASKKKKQSPPPVVNEVLSPEPSTLSGDIFVSPSRAPRGSGPEFAGQSGDLQDLSTTEIADSESVAELVAEGQYREAEIIGAVESADEPDKSEVRTREVPEDDVPQEYLDKD